MTARVTTLKGPDAGHYYTDEMGSYYLDGDEPPGRWQGRGAAQLGLSGEIDEAEFLALMDGTDPATGRLLGSKHTDASVRGFDVTFSAPKSLSVLYALGGPEVAADVLAAHDAAVGAVVEWIDDHAHTRYRVNGDVCIFDSDGIVATLFRQHVSRELDPQLHTHVVIANRVLANDGRWLALDARTLKHDQKTISWLYHAALRAEMTARLGVAWAIPVNGIAEIADVPPEVLAAYSSRTKEMRSRLDKKIVRFTSTFERTPTPRERWQLEREAVIDSRPSKTSSDAPTLAQEWTARLVTLGGTPAGLVADTVGRVEPTLFDGQTADRVMHDAVTALSESQSTWRPAEISREIAAALPTTLGLDANELTVLVEELRARVEDELLIDLSPPVPSGVARRRDGRPVTEAATDRRFTTAEVRDQEIRINDRAQTRLDVGGRDAQSLVGVGAADDLDCTDDQRGSSAQDPEPMVLSGPQREAAAAVSGTRQLVLVVGPAGTGKTTALRPAVAQLRAEDRAVFGVAPSATAAEVLALDTGVETDTLDKLLVEHRDGRRPSRRYDLPAGATVLVDEAAMVSTANLAELFTLADTRQWRLALVGDPFQFAAVGRSGMFGHLVDRFGSINLDQVHRFDQPWERNASLRLRRGDPTVVAGYDTHGRLHGGTNHEMVQGIIDAWWQARDVGETVAMMAPTRDAVGELNHNAQRRRIDAHQLDPTGAAIDKGDYRLFVGDEIATRHNERAVTTDRGHMVKNRDHWLIETVHPDGGLTVFGRTGRVRLDSDYVTEHVELAYAETSHANQGRTVDRSYLYLDTPTDTRGVYVPLTRGRLTNEAFVAVTGNDTAADVITEAVTRTWIDRPALEVQAELNPPLSAGASHEGGKDPRRNPTEVTAAEHRRRFALARNQAREVPRGTDLQDEIREVRRILAQRPTTGDDGDMGREVRKAFALARSSRGRGIKSPMSATDVAQAQQPAGRELWQPRHPGHVSLHKTWISSMLRSIANQVASSWPNWGWAQGVRNTSWVPTRRQTTCASPGVIAAPKCHVARPFGAKVISMTLSVPCKAFTRKPARNGRPAARSSTNRATARRNLCWSAVVSCWKSRSKRGSRW